MVSRRRHRRGDLCDGGGPGDSRPVPLPEKRDVSEPGSEGCQTGRQPGFPVQQPGHLPEHLRGKHKGVFYLAKGRGSLPVPPLDARRLTGSRNVHKQVASFPKCKY